MRKLDGLAQLVQCSRHPDYVLERCALRIEIEDAPIRLLNGLNAARPDVQRDRRHVRDVSQTLFALDNEVTNLALRAFAPQRLEAQPLGREFGRIFLVERLALDTVRIASQNQGTILQVRQKVRSNG